MDSLHSETVLDGRYRLLDYLDAGGQGEVITAWDEIDHRKVAVKFQHPRGLEGTETYKSCGVPIREEARRGCQLNGIRSIPQVIDCAPDDAVRAYFVMEYIGGKSLRQFIGDYRPVGRHATAAVIAQLCEILDAVHARGLVHRDVKPDNILIDLSGAVWLIDVGSATPAGELAGDRGGTPGYAAPEQYDLTVVPTPRTDLFGLGCTLFEMCMPTKPFVDLHGAPKPDSAPFPPGTPGTMNALLRDLATEMISYDPSNRPDSAGDIHDRLFPLLLSKGSRPPTKVTDHDPTAWYRDGRGALM
jgi:serine/threonine-protein kinase